MCQRNVMVISQPTYGLLENTSVEYSLGPSALPLLLVMLL